MAAHPNQFGRSKDGNVEAYQEWKTRRSHLFGNPTLHPPMASLTVVQIGVIAENHAKLVSMPNTLYDSHIENSLISKSRALATQGQIRQSTPISVKCSLGRSYRSGKVIDLRWRYDGGTQSFSETFYIVDSCGEFDAILKSRASTLPYMDAIPAAYPICRDVDRARDRSEADRAREREKEYKEQVEAQRAAVRKQMEASKSKKGRH